MFSTSRSDLYQKIKSFNLDANKLTDGSKLKFDLVLLNSGSFNFH